MKRETISYMLNCVDDSYISETAAGCPASIQEGSERTIHMKKRRIITFALAAVLILGLGIGAYASGLFGSGKVKITSATVDRSDPAWEKLLEDAPYANEMQYVQWEPHNNLPTGKITAILDQMEGTEESSHRAFSNVTELEDAYGIEVLKLGQEPCNVQAWLGFCNEENHSDGARLHGSWNSREDGVYLFTECSYLFNSKTNRSSLGNPLTKTEERREYEIRSLGVTAELISGLIEKDGESVREITAYFSYGGIDYGIAAILDPTVTPKEKANEVTMDWLCGRLETLRKPSWVSANAGPVEEDPGFGTEEAGPSGVRFSRKTVDHDDPEWEDRPDVKERLFIEWSPHGNHPTAELRALLDEIDAEEAVSQSFESVDEMEDAYGIRLLRMNENESELFGLLRKLASGSCLNVSWSGHVEEADLTVFAQYYCDPELSSMIGTSWASIEEESEYMIRSLGVTARLVSGQEMQFGIPMRKIAAFFSFDGVDYMIAATANDSQGLTADWLCAFLETLHR